MFSGGKKDFSFQIFFDHFSDHTEFTCMEDVKGYTIVKRGGIALVDQKNHAYIRNRTRKNGKIYWQCLKRKSNCKARLVTLQNKIIQTSGEHDHPAPEACYEYTGFTAPNF